MGAAIELNRVGYDNIAILDREDDLGGTWHVNHYPKLAVDVPTTTYSYWIEPYPYWSRLYAPGEEIKLCAGHVADKYDLRRYMRFGTTVEGARWDEEAQVWRVALADGETLTARFLITATGYLSQPRTPDIPGITNFNGKLIHSTRWDHSYVTDTIGELSVVPGVVYYRWARPLAVAASKLSKMHMFASIRGPVSAFAAALRLPGECEIVASTRCPSL
jgi:cation diffusion facilitator CzcD-associated flavoprotein CzcO